jgi:Icc protein
MVMTLLHILKRFRSLSLLFTLLLVFSGCAHKADIEPEEPHHLVILGDPHLPGRDVAKKEKVVQTINSWSDVEMVIAVGDICADFGTDEEFSFAQSFFAKLHAPFFAITGNHDYFYADPQVSGGQLMAGSREVQERKLAKFRGTFGLPIHYYSKYVGDYLLVFLSADHATFLSALSEAQLAWLRLELAANARTPTIVIFHGPLNNTLRNYRHWINTPNFVAQPVEEIDKILKDNRQVFMWVSGHTHTPPSEESYASAINLYDGSITNIHNKDMNRSLIWTNSLYLYEDKVVVKTYSHEENGWMPGLERTIETPDL